VCVVCIVIEMSQLSVKSVGIGAVIGALTVGLSAFAWNRYQNRTLGSGLSNTSVPNLLDSPLYKSASATILPDPPQTTEERMLWHVILKAEQGNPDSVLQVIDKFGWESEWMMNVGDTKGAILDQAIKTRNPKRCLELGAYCGYSAVRTARLLPEGAHLYSIEYNPIYAAISTKVVEWAGLSSRVTILVGTLDGNLSNLKRKYKLESLDFVFIDHFKPYYLSDFQILERSGLLVSGTHIVADNVIAPGVPEYVEYLQSSPNYTNKLHQSHVEYNPNIKDGVLISIRK